MSEDRRHYLYPNRILIRIISAHRQNRESVWGFPIWSWHQRQNWCCGIHLKSLIQLTMLRKLWWDRDYLKHQHFSLILDPCGFLLPYHFSSMTTVSMQDKSDVPSSFLQNSCWIFPQPAYVVFKDICDCPTLSVIMSALLSPSVRVAKKSYRHGDPVISTWASWVRSTCASSCTWVCMAHLKHVRLSTLFSLVACQVCQYVWQWVCKVVVFLLGEDSKKSSFFAYS